MITATIKKIASFFIFTLLMVSMGTSVSAQSTPFYGDNIIKDGDFPEDTLTSVWQEGGDAAKGELSIVNGELAITNLVATANQYDYQVQQPLSADQIAELAKGGTFELSFDARTTAAAGKTFHVFLGEVGGSWARYWESNGGAGDITVTNTMETYTLTADIVNVWDAMAFALEVSTDTSSLFIDNIQLRNVKDNIVRNGDFSADSLWAFELGGAATSIGIVNEELVFTGITGVGNTYDAQARQDFNQAQRDSLYAGPYEVSFQARTNAGTRPFHLFFGEVGGGWGRYFDPGAEGLITVDDTMKTYTLTAAVDAIPAMRIGFEVNYAGTGGSTDLFIDNVLVTRITDVVPDAPEFALSTTDGVVTVTVTDNGAASYDVYFADSAYTDTKEAQLIGSIDPTNGFTLEHSTSAPHPSLAFDFTAHYGVVAKSEKGSSSDLTVNSISTGMTTAENYVYELTQEGMAAVLGAFESGTFPEGATLASFFPETYEPFVINSSSKVTEGGAPDDDADVSGNFWIGFDAANSFLVIYAEVTDDSLVFATHPTNSDGAWNFDNYEMGIGNYSPESFLEGSTHQDLLGGAEPDWQLRGGGIVRQSGALEGFIHANGKAPRINGEIPNSQTLLETTADGYRTLTVANLNELAGGVSTDAAFSLPTGTEWKTYPLNVAINDNDDQSRESQLVWAKKATSGNWWQNPFQWDVVAFYGSDAVATSNEDEGLDNVREFSLEQNYPNPFNPTTNITFTLAKSGNVTLEIFNMLGQKVSTLLREETMSVGTYNQTFDASSLASGMYVYRLSTGNFVQSRKMMLIK